LLAQGAVLLFEKPLFDAFAMEDMFTGEAVDLLLLFNVAIADRAQLLLVDL